MLGTTLLTCPVRGQLNAAALAKDGLTPTEERRRIELIQYLLDREYPADHLAVETIIIRRLGQGRNSLRADAVVYDIPRDQARKLEMDERLRHILLVAEVKRDSKKAKSAIDTQLEPAVRQLPNLDALGIYWDDVNRLLFHRIAVKTERGDSIEVEQDTLANLPPFGQPYKYRPLTLDVLTPPSNIVAMLETIANALRSEGVNDEQMRYKETVKLLLARYVDEREAPSRKGRVLALQVYDGGDPVFMARLEPVYDAAATRYSRAETLFRPVRTSELNEKALRRIVKVIEGAHLSEADNDALQQVFMSFVPAVFKKSLDQYFTPLTLINTMVEMTDIGPNDKVADPAMGTADFLSSAMAHRTSLGDSDMTMRVFGVDKDQQAYDLAVINMILNHDGQAGLKCVDSLEQMALWDKEMNVVLCNPPFGSQTVEKREEVLAGYDLGHRWERDPKSGKWQRTDAVLEAQQLGILFIERGYKMLVDGGRLAIIVPEGYLCTATYGYIRQWLLDHMEVMSLIELPRRMFLKSEADLRSNVLLARRLTPSKLAERQRGDYPIYTNLVRKVGHKLGKGFPKIYLRDDETGLQRMDEDNSPLIDTDFTGVLSGFRRYLASRDKGTPWEGARFSDVAEHSNLDMKPRRLMPAALRNLREIRSRRFVVLGDVADILEDTIDIGTQSMRAVLRRLVEGQSIRAVEGLVIPGAPERSWEIAERKSRDVYQLRERDIIVGLVRPERRNIGMLLDDGSGLADVVGSPDGIAVVRPRVESCGDFPVGWLFETLRSEPCRLQLWTESGGTSYGKLTLDHVRNIHLPLARKPQRLASDARVREWAKASQAAFAAWNRLGAPADRIAIVNSAIVGLDGDE